VSCNAWASPSEQWLVLTPSHIYPMTI